MTVKIKTTDVLFWTAAIVFLSIVVAVGLNLYRLSYIVDRRQSELKVAERQLDIQGDRLIEIKKEQYLIRSQIETARNDNLKLAGELEQIIKNGFVIFHRRKVILLQRIAENDEEQQSLMKRSTSDGASQAFISNLELDTRRAQNELVLVDQQKRQLSAVWTQAKLQQTSLDNGTAGSRP